MPKKGTVVCRSCDANFTGVLPDHEEVGHEYKLTYENNKPDETTSEKSDSNLLNKLKKHHLDTGIINPHYLNKIMLGHKHYDVFLEDGSMGDLEANSYYVIYTERGKER